MKSSLRPEIREGFASRNILYICLGLPQILLLVHFLDALRVYITTGQFPHLLYQACIDPTSHYSIPFYTLLPFQVIMTYIYLGFAAYNNIYLYRFLRYGNELIKHSYDKTYLTRTHEGKVTGKLKSESDQKRERKRNLVPAKTGIYVLILTGIYSIIHTVSYFSFSDSGTREYFLSLAVDLLSCIIAPGIRDPCGAYKLTLIQLIYLIKSAVFGVVWTSRKGPCQESSFFKLRQSREK